MTASDRPGAISIEPLTPKRWPDLVALFGPSGAYGSCWCTWWRQSGRAFGAGCADHGAGNRALLEGVAAGGRRPGLIAYRDRAPVGWVSVAPRSEFGRILRSPTLRPGPGDDPADPGIWSIVCFWMPRPERGKGLATQLLEAAVEHARRAGARAVEAYPVDTANRRAPSANLFTGTLGMFERAGFTELPRRRRGSQAIVQLGLAPADR